MVLVPPTRYGGLGAGPGWVRRYEAQTSIPLSGSKSILIDPVLGSPFVFRIVPPEVLVEAISGGAAARAGNIFDRLLADQRQAVLDGIPAGTALTDQEQTLLGTRVPNSPQGVVIASALRATNNFERTKQRQNKARQLVPRRGDDSDVPLTDPLVGGDGKRFSPQRDRSSTANQLAVADTKQSRGIMGQLIALASTPPLTLLINPQSLTVTYTKKQSYQDRTRTNYLFQSWGEDQPKLSVQGRIGAFVAGSVAASVDASGQRVLSTEAASGVQFATKRDSGAFQNLMNLMTVYRNNAYIYDLVGRSEAHWWIGSIQIEYDQYIYQGQFDSFTYSYSDDRQGGGLEFGFEFTVSAMYDTCQDVSVVPVGSNQQASPLPVGEAPAVYSGEAEGGEGGLLLNPAFRR